MVDPRRLHESNLPNDLSPHVQCRASLAPFPKRKRRPRILQDRHDSYTERWNGFSERVASLGGEAANFSASSSEKPIHLSHPIDSRILTVDEIDKRTAHPVEHIARFILCAAKGFP